MINSEELANGLQLLSKHFGKELLPEVITIWSKYLNENLDTGGFLEAVENAILSKNFMPTPFQLVEFVNGTREAKALEEWQLVIYFAAGGGQLEPETLSARGFHALRAIGGLKAVSVAEQRRLESLERYFVKAYTDCTPRDIKLLPQAPHLETEQPRREHVSVPIPEHIKKQINDLFKKKRGEE